MRNPRHIAEIPKSGGFSLHYHVGRLLRVGFGIQCCIIAAFTIIAVLLAGLVDHTLLMGRRDVGLLQHPTIWCFISLQIALPLSIKHSLKQLVRARSRIRDLVKLDGQFSNLIGMPLTSFLRLESNESRVVATIVYCFGLSAFVWNTYQNQLPRIIVPYDFWDSTNHAWGFWITRIYKLYLFGWLLPYIALVHVGILVVVLRLMRRARTCGKLTIAPFHPDGTGGLSFVPGLMLGPIIVALVMGSIATAAAFHVHKAADITPIMGLTIMLVSTIIAYIAPTLFLRSDIIAVKREAVRKLRLLQQGYYSKIIEGKGLDFEILREGNEALDYFDKVCARIQAISNYPHLKRLVEYIGLALTPSFFSFAVKLYDNLLPIIYPQSKKP